MCKIKDSIIDKEENGYESHKENFPLKAHCYCHDSIQEHNSESLKGLDFHLQPNYERN